MIKLPQWDTNSIKRKIDLFAEIRKRQKGVLTKADNDEEDSQNGVVLQFWMQL